jgi:hypothetical protein
MAVKMVNAGMLRPEPDATIIELGSVRHALSNGAIVSAAELACWSAKRLTQRLGVRPHELRRIEACLHDRGLRLADE